MLQEIHVMGVLIEDGRRNRRKPRISTASIDEQLKMDRKTSSRMKDEKI
jgi:hypothetical protein